MRNLETELVAGLLLVFVAGSAQAITLDIIGPGAGFQDVSANGAKVLLFDYGPANAYIWTAEEGLVFIGSSGDANSPIYEISGDGTTVVGSMTMDGLKQAVIWTEDGGWQGLGGSTTGCVIGDDLSSGWGISGDGSVAVGLAWSTVGPSCKARAFRWTENGGIVLLNTPGDGNSRASAVSTDGQVAVGWTETSFGTWRPTIWQADGTEELIDPDPTEFSEAIAANADGSVVVGELNKHAFRWTAASGPVDLGLVPGIGGPLSRAVGVSADGNTIVGWGGSPPINLRGFVWTPSAGMRNLHDLVTDAGIDIGNQILTHATAVSADGSTIVGALFNPANFTYQAYRLTLGDPQIPPLSSELRLGRTTEGSIDLSWSPTCLLTETDYGIYEGQLGDFSSHTARLCSTGGETQATIEPPSGSSYYLVVPINGDYEGSYGADSEGNERPRGETTCVTKLTTGTCI